MSKLSALIFLISIAGLSARAQQRSMYKTGLAEWSEHPTLHDLPPQYNHESAVMLVHNVTLDYRFEGKGIDVYYTMHRIVKVMDDRGIEQFNKVSIPVHSRTRVPLIKARTILPDGTVKEIAQDMIKVTRNEYGQYEIVFAMEGMEKNAEIELLLQEIRPYAAFGTETFQYPIPVVSTHFEIDYPRDIVFEEKSYNGFPEATDVLMNNRRHISITANDIPALKHEPNSFYDLHLQRAEYRVHKYIDVNDIDTASIYTWDNFARRMYDDNYLITQKERAAVNNYLTTLGARPTNSDAENVRLIEDGIKNNIVLDPNMDGNNTDVLDSIITNKAATPSGYIKLFAACFTQAGVTHELGMTMNRKERRFDTKFENWGNMENYVFYFPKLKGFLSPLSVYTRYPIVPDDVLGTKGIFCTIPAQRDMTGPMTEIKTITPLGTKETQDNISAGVSFTKDMNANVDIAYSYTGYAATGIRKKLLLEPKDKEKNIVNNIVSIAENPADIKKYTISNQAINSSYANAPLEITASVNTGDLTEKAGKQYLFKLGELAGAHSSLYYEKDRVMPVDLDYPVSMNHTFTINIPKGYKVMNPEAIKMHADYVNSKLKPVISFNSDYTLKKDRKHGDKLIVTVKEYYPQTHFSTDEYPRFRNVVNTAADFNKVTLLLAKRG